MIASWMLYASAVALLFGLTAAAAEGALLRWKLAARWAWVLALAASLVVPLAAVVAPRSESLAVDVSIEAAQVGAPGEPGDPRPGSGWGWSDAADLRPLDRPLLAAWALSSAAILAVLAVSARALRGRRRRWRAAVVSGAPVWLSRDTGPAVVGFRRCEIVLPEWAASLDPARSTLLIRHEEEHVRARDPWLLVFGLLSLVAYPWALPLWWQVRRLRSAIEIDCDRRVLRGAGDPWAYGSLLLEVGSRVGRAPMPLAAFSERATQLERRVRILTGPPRGPRWLAAAAGAAACVVLLVAACEMEAPTARDVPEVDEPAVEPAVAPAVDATAIAAGPDTATAAPPSDEPGAAGADTVSRDAADTTEVADFIRGLRRLAGEAPSPPPAPGPADTLTAPEFTPYDQRPELVNRDDYGRALEAAYPAMLRDAGIGGTTVFWVHVDERGAVLEASIARGSGHEPLDAASLSVMSTVPRFSPARLAGQPVAVWIQIPVTMQTR